VRAFNALWECRLQAALFLSAGLVFAAGLFTVVWFGSHHRRAANEPGRG
jgi:hypothetical protein